MIKKLVKYGNSHALVLDKALLEILNISDTTSLKLATDGKSLTITPLVKDPEAPNAHLSVAEDETVKHYSNLFLEQNKKSLENISSEIFGKTILDFNALEKKYNYFNTMKEINNNPLFKEALALLDQKARTENFTADVYMQELVKLQKSFKPDFPFDEFRRECANLEKNAHNTSIK